MLETLSAITVSAGVLLSIVLLMTAINFIAIRRGERPITDVPDAAKTEPAKVKTGPQRRAFLIWMGLAWTAFTASAGVMLSATGRFMFPNVLFEPPSTFKAGDPGVIRVGQVDQRFKEDHGVWLVKDVDPDTGHLIIYALSDICTHLGCIPNWLESEQKFKCPCHGSGYYKSGINFEGPTPRPLERFEISLADDGQILVDKSHKFQQEKGEWADPRSFLSVRA